MTAKTEIHPETRGTHRNLGHAGSISAPAPVHQHWLFKQAQDKLSLRLLQTDLHKKHVGLRSLSNYYFFCTSLEKDFPYVAVREEALVQNYKVTKACYFYDIE